jgi:hypothetical protein
MCCASYKRLGKQNCQYRQCRELQRSASGLESVIIMKVLERSACFVSDISTHNSKKYAVPVILHGMTKLLL